MSSCKRLCRSLLLRIGEDFFFFFFGGGGGLAPPLLATGGRCSPPPDLQSAGASTPHELTTGAVGCGSAVPSVEAHPTHNSVVVAFVTFLPLSCLPGSHGTGESDGGSVQTIFSLGKFPLGRSMCLREARGTAFWVPCRAIDGEAPRFGAT